MGNQIGRIVLGIIIGAAALVGIYLVLPGGAKHPLQEWFQKTFQSGTYAVAEEYQKKKVPGYDMTFGDMIANCSDGSSAWVVDVLAESDDKSTGSYDVYAYATKVDISMSQENGQDNLKSFSQASVEIQFSVEKKADGSFVTHGYDLRIDDVTQNDFYKAEALSSMVSHAQSGSK